MNNDIQVELKWLILPSFLYTDTRLTGLQIKLFSFINTFKGDYFVFSNIHLGKMFGVGEKAVSEAITKLKEFGYVELDYKIKADGGKVRFIKALQRSIPRQELEQDSESRSRPSRNPALGHDNGNKINGNNNTNTEKTTPSVKTDIVPSSKNSFIPMTDIEIWELAGDMDIPIDDVKRTHDAIFDYVAEKGRKYKTVYFTLRNWLRMGLERGSVGHMTEADHMTYKEDHPDRVKWKKEIIAKAIKEGRL